MNSKDYMYDDHDQQFSFEPHYMGELHVNMNDGGRESLGDQRRASHTMVVGAKVIDSTKRTERTDKYVKSQNTSNSMSESMAGKVLYERIK